MPTYTTKPLSFREAGEHFAEAVSLPIGLTSAEISNQVPSRIRSASFLSARVASATILQGLRTAVEGVLQGELDVNAARAMAKTFLASQGVGIPDPDSAAAGNVRKLGSTARLELVIRQNVRMAAAKAQREVGEHPAVMEFLPFYTYHANTARHRAWDGITLRKTDPWWNEHMPPNGFNCDCWVTDEAESPADAKAPPPMPRADGFTFDSRPGRFTPDFETIADPGLREAVRASFAERDAA